MGEIMNQEILSAISKVIDSGKFILGKEVTAFEEEFSKFCKVRFAVGVANGTEALYLALKALGIGSQDQVITVSHTAPATAAAIKMAGATPVYVDINENTFLMDPKLIEACITYRTKVIMPVHLYGRMCDMITIKQIADSYGLYIIEDCAQSVGAGYLFGDIGCYSFYPTKNLGACGDGGCVVTNHENFADRVRRLREYGYGERFVSNILGINSRLDEIQAAVLRVKLKYLNDEITRRWQLASFYNNNLKFDNLVLPDMEGTFHQYVVKTNTILRNELVNKLNLQIHYPRPCHLQPAYRSYISLPVTESVCEKIFSMPMRINIEEAKKICKEINLLCK